MLNLRPGFAGSAASFSRGGDALAWGCGDGLFLGKWTQADGLESS